MRLSPPSCTFCLVLLGLWAAPVWAQEADSAAVFLAQGQAHFEQFQNAEALRAFQQAHAHAPEDFEVLTWLVRTHIDYAQDLQVEDEDAAAEQYFQQAIAFSEALREHHPDRPETHFLLASSYGKMAQFKGGREKVKIGRQVEGYAQKAIALDSTYALPYVVLGIFYREVARLNWIERTFAKTFFGGLPDGSYERSARMLERAVALYPTLSIAHYELAITLNEMDERQRAIEHLQQVVELSPLTTQERRNQGRARDLLAAWTGG